MGRSFIPGLAVQAAETQINRNNKKPGTAFYSKCSSRPQDHPGKCMVAGCGKVLDMLTYPHAERHGYSSPLEQYNAGMYKHINFRQIYKKEVEGIE